MRLRYQILQRLFAAFAAWIFSVSAALSASVVFTEDFSSGSVFNSGNPYLGGWFSPQVGFGQWVGTSGISITTGALQTTTTSATRSAGIVLSPSLFTATGAGSYSFTFDITSYTGDSDDRAIVNIWAGRGYDMTNSSGNALILDTFRAELVAVGPSTSRELLNSATYNAPATAVEITFEYQEGDAVAIFLGAHTGNWPFPTVRFDNLSLAFVPPAPIPEPSSSILFALFTSLALLHRRR